MASYRPYTYFCGANISVSMGSGSQRLVDEIVGISYNVMDSATPIYVYDTLRGASNSTKQGDVTMIGPFNIYISMGGPNPNEATFTTRIFSAYIISHAQTIQIDEQVILQEYNFIARDLKEATLSIAQ